QFQGSKQNPLELSPLVEHRVSKIQRRLACQPIHLKIVDGKQLRLNDPLKKGAISEIHGTIRGCRAAKQRSVRFDQSKVEVIRRQESQVGKMSFAERSVRRQNQEGRLRECGEQLAAVLDEVLLIGHRQLRDGSDPFSHAGLFNSTLFQIAVQHQSERGNNQQQHQQVQPRAKKRGE